MKRKLPSVLLSALLLLGALPLSASAAGGVSYLDWNDQKKEFETQTCTDYTTVTESTTKWNAEANGGWYVVSSDVTINDYIVVTGNVHLILMDGCMLTTSSTIEVNEGDSLTIYAQSTDKETMGKLYATGTAYMAGIGGAWGSTGGEITINGGSVNADSDSGGAAIGGGYGGAGGEITINGGSVTATGRDGAAIGGGYNSAGGEITINGGHVEASSTNSAAIGGGYWGAGGTIAINGGSVTATGRDGAAIGGGYMSGCASIQITGGTVVATTDGEGDGIGGGANQNCDTVTISGNNTVVLAICTDPGNRPSPIGANNETPRTGGLIIEGSSGTLYSSLVTLPGNFAIPEGVTLTIPEGKTLTIPEGVVLTNNGTIRNYGTLKLFNNNSLTGDGLVQNASSVTVTVEQNSTPTSSASYGSTVTLKATAQAAPATNALRLSAAPEKVNFYLGDTDGTLLGTADVTKDNLTSVATLTLTLSGDIWANGFQIGDNTITADFGGSADPGLMENTGTATLTVTKATQEPPSAPTLAVKSSTGVTLNTVDANSNGVTAQYRKGEEVWGSSPAFTDLTPGDTYSFTVRYQKTDYYMASAASAALLVTLPAADGSGVVKPGETVVIGDVTITNGGDIITVRKDGTTTTITPETSDEISMIGDKVVAPENSTVKTGDGPEMKLPSGGKVDVDGTITVPEDGTVKVNDTTITPPIGGEVKPTTDGKIEVPAGSTVTKQGGASIEVPKGGGVVDPNTGAVTPNLHTVTFDSQDGSAVDPATAPHDGAVTSPTNPIRSGYTFGGWYKDTDYKTPWDFDSDTVTSNITLYAKWTRQSGSSGGGGSYTPPSYKPDVAQPGEGGEVSATPASPKRGDNVTVVTKPENGYEVDKLIVTDQNGKQVKIKDNGDGTFSFTQPTGKVKIEVTYKLTETKWSNPFTDVAQGAWYYESIAFVVEKGLFYGTSDTTFSPNATMTRAMLMTVLAHADGQDTTAPEGGKWYDAGMKWAVKQGISDGTNPDTPITREQLATMLYHYAGSPAAPNLVLDFTDADQVSDYAQDALRWAVEKGIIAGKGVGVLDPRGDATRAEVAAVLQHFCSMTEK